MQADGQRTGIIYALILVVWGAVLIGAGSVVVGNHPVDAAHYADIAARIAAGERPHMDFLTPLGVAVAWPIAALAGPGLGAVFLKAQVLVLAVVLALAWWPAVSRLTQGLATAFGLLVAAVAGAMVYGGSSGALSVSMFYNRWAWAVAFSVMLIALVDPPDGRGETRDGLVAGLGLSLLALGKATFFVGLAPAVALAFLLRGAWRGLGAGLATGAVMALAATAWAGDPAFLLAYVEDLRVVAASGTRPYATAPFSEIVLGARFLPANLLLFGAVLMFRRLEMSRSALVLVVAAPGLLFITFQNWGNDPLWLAALGVALWGAALQAEHGRPARGGGDPLALGTAAVALALIAPVLANLAVSPMRNFQFDRAQAVPLLSPSDPTLLAPEKIANAIKVSLPGLDALEVGDGALPPCKLTRGYTAAMARIADRLAEDPRLTGKAVFVADSVSPLHLFGPFAPVRHGAVWYYGGTETIRRADFVLAPVCPTSRVVRDAALAAIADDPALSLTEIDRTDDYALYVLAR